MRTKRSTESKKTTARGARATTKATRAAAGGDSIATKKAWVAGIDGLSLGIAGAAIVVAGILVAAYRPAHPEEINAKTEASTAVAKLDASFDARGGTDAPSKTIDETASRSGSTWPTPLTITGCLDRDGDAYRLTDAVGIGLPKSRSWKSAFLKKNASSITVVDADRRARLQDHLGQRVTVTGTMVNREMQIGSMRLLSESCSEKTKI